MALLVLNAPKSTIGLMLGLDRYGMCSVAAGRSSVFYEVGPHPWDACAATCLVREAGGVAMSVDGSPFDLWFAFFKIKIMRDCYLPVFGFVDFVDFFFFS
jgi:fructose-1,6-bisphosphatase/inositol monophosphatase family enzyme